MPVRRSTPKMMHRAGELRKAPTPAEAQLWIRLRKGRLRGVTFRRQHAIGGYVADFCAPRHKLIIELDGSPHTRSTEPDRARSIALESRGYKVLRFWNDQVLNDIEQVAGEILNALQLA